MRLNYNPQLKTLAMTVLASNEGNVKRTIRELAEAGFVVKRSTLRDWKKREELTDDELKAYGLETLAAGLQLGVEKYLAVLVSDEVIATIASQDPRALGTNLGILFDKLTATRGKPDDVAGGKRWESLLNKVAAALAEDSAKKKKAA